MKTTHDPDETRHPAAQRLTRRRVLLGAAGSAGALAVLPAIGGLGAPNRLIHDDHDDDKIDNDVKDDEREQDDDHDHDSSGHGSEGDDDEIQATGEVPAGSTEVRIDDDDADGFAPSPVSIDMGQSVTFVNLDDDAHTATGSDWDTGIIQPGEMATVTFDTAGTFAYACQIHPVMTGRVDVRNADGVVPASPEASPVASPAATPDAAGGATDAAVTIREFAFDPPEIEVSAGTTVTWTNQDQASHTATSLDGEFDTGTLGNGDSASQTFDTAGRFDYQCAIHPDMTGTVVVS